MPGRDRDDGDRGGGDLKGGDWRAEDRRLLLLFCLVLIVVAALFLRLDAVGGYLREHPDSAVRLVGDEPGYDYLARRVAEGESLDWPARMPLYPAFLGIIYLLFRGGPTAALWVQAFLGAGTVLLLYWLARREHGRGVALVAAALVAFHPALISQATRLHTENVYLPLLILAVAALFRLLRKPSVPAAALFGLAAAATVYCRPSGALLPMVLVLAALVRGWDRETAIRVTATALGIVALTLVPWTVHNWRTYGVVHPLTTSTAVLWQGSPAYYRLAQRGRSYLDIWQNELDPADNGGYDPTRWEGDRHFTREAVTSILRHPIVYAWYSVQKIVYFWAGHPSADWGSLPYFDTWWERVKWVATLLFAPLCLVAAWFLRDRWTRDLLPYALLAVYFTAVHALLWAELRLSLPMHPFLALVPAILLSRRWLGGDGPSQRRDGTVQPWDALRGFRWPWPRKKRKRRDPPPLLGIDR